MNCPLRCRIGRSNQALSGLAVNRLNGMQTATRSAAQRRVVRHADRY